MIAPTRSYHLHKPTGQAVVTMDGRDLYLGNHGCIEGRAECDRLIAGWLANGRRLRRPAPAPGLVALTVNEPLLAYVAFAEGSYRKGDRPTKGPSNIRLTIRPPVGSTATPRPSVSGPWVSRPSAGR